MNDFRKPFKDGLMNRIESAEDLLYRIQSEIQKQRDDFIRDMVKHIERSNKEKNEIDF